MIKLAYKITMSQIKNGSVNDQSSVKYTYVAIKIAPLLWILDPSMTLFQENVTLQDAEFMILDNSPK